MIRPSPRLLGLAVGASSLTAIAVAFGPHAGGALAAWATVAALALADLLGSAGGRRLALSARAPPELLAGESGDLVLTLDGWRGAVRNRPSCRLAYPAGLSGPADVRLAAPGDPPMPVRVTARRRGQWTIPRVWLNWRSRLGLFEYGKRVAVAIEIRVSPNIRRVRSGEIDVAVRSALYGMRANVLSGEGSEFHQLCDYARGMDPRGIDWKHSARHRSLLAKEMRAERNHSILFALDNGYLMREEIAGIPKIDHHIAAMLSLAWAGILGGDRVGLFAFDARPRAFHPPEGGRGAFLRLRGAAAELDYLGVETNFTIAMAYLHERLRRRSLVVVFSDFVDSTTAELMLENVAMLNRQHVIVFAALRDPALRALADGRPSSLSDVARSVSAAQVLNERRLVFERLTRIGVIAFEAAEEALTGRLLSTYLTIKAREMV